MQKEQFMVVRRTSGLLIKTNEVTSPRHSEMDAASETDRQTDRRRGFCHFEMVTLTVLYFFPLVHQIYANINNYF